MTVLVTAASRHGGTREIAEAIARELEAQGVSVELRELEEVSDLGRYDAVVLGSAVYLGRWLEPALRFVERHADELAERKTWLFSSGPIVGDPPRPDPAQRKACQRPRPEGRNRFPPRRRLRARSEAGTDRNRPASGTGRRTVAASISEGRSGRARQAGADAADAGHFEEVSTDGPN